MTSRLKARHQFQSRGESPGADHVRAKDGFAAAATKEGEICNQEKIVSAYDGGVATYPIRTYGDPILRQVTTDVEDIDEGIVRLVEDMIQTMHEAPGVGLAATQVGIQKRLFVYDVGDGPHAVLNGRITESSGEWTYEEGCLSVPGLFWPITRPNSVVLEGIDLEGNEIKVEGSELLGRVFQHEIDHLDGVLLIERLDPDQYKQAMKILRSQALNAEQERAKHKLFGKG